MIYSYWYRSMMAWRISSLRDCSSKVFVAIWRLFCAWGSPQVAEQAAPAQYAMLTLDEKNPTLINRGVSPQGCHGFLRNRYPPINKLGVYESWLNIVGKTHLFRCIQWTALTTQWTPCYSGALGSSFNTCDDQHGQLWRFHSEQGALRRLGERDCYSNRVFGLLDLELPIIVLHNESQVITINHTLALSFDHYLIDTCKPWYNHYQ